LNGEVEPTIDAEGRVTKYDYDAFRRLQRVTDANGLVVEQTTKYDAINRPLIMVDRFGQSTSYAYDDG
jgi:YD repeat-containing protein